MRRIASAQLLFLGAVALLAAVTLKLSPQAQARTIKDPDAIPEMGTLGAPLAGVPDVLRWNRGRLLFDDDMPASMGLGPFFNADSCQACHNLGAIGGSGRRDLNVFRFAAYDADTGEVSALPGGPLLSRVSVVGVDREQPPEGELITEERNAPPVFGLGLIGAITVDDLVALEDPDDVDGDGISGRVHWVGDAVGRYGWKAQIPTVRSFVLDALFQELGLTVPDDGSGFAIPTDVDLVEDPEASDEIVDDITYYLNELGPPPRREPVDDAEAARIDAGEVTFEAVGCAACHVPELPSALGPVQLYSDLLLHDVAPTGAIGIPDGDADGREYRTPPLWGLRHSLPYMHNGSAESVHDAILAHRSEGDASREAYEALSQSERDDLISFLESL